MKKAYLFFVLLSVLTSCKKDTTPSWLVINSVNFTTNETTEGVNSNGIEDVWVYMDNQPMGVFDLPARIPLLAEGEHNFIIYAGIKINGINATRTKYPFYQRYETTLNLVKDQEIEIIPSFTYKSNTQFVFIEDFEDVGIGLYKDPSSDTNIINITAAQYPDVVIYGNNCGMIYLDETDSICKIATSSNLNLPKGEEVYVEVDYMNTNTVLFSTVRENVSGSIEDPLVIMRAQDESELKWKKIYFELKENVSYDQNATSFEIVFTSILDSDLSNAVIYFDNIKVLRYE
ncbi:MAG: hypothetical protein R2780_06790 [Crocinitomicaceae bacterium]|nr:hypothetical protein [Crocinitomicaceae bacterium]